MKNTSKRQKKEFFLKKMDQKVSDLARRKTIYVGSYRCYQAILYSYILVFRFKFYRWHYSWFTLFICQVFRDILNSGVQHCNRIDTCYLYLVFGY